MDILRIQALFDEVCDLSPPQRLEELRKRRATPEEIQEVLRYCEADEKAAQNELFENGIIQLKRVSMIGEEIRGYQIVKELQGGGMGEVYLAEGVSPQLPQARQRAVIKIVGANLAQEEWRRFAAEREILAALKHQNIAQYYDGDRLADGRPFMIMEYVEGKSLREVMFERRQRPFTPQEILTLTQQACAGIGAAHAKGVIHRDIKPENLIIAETAAGLTVTVIDFGIAIPKDLPLQLTIKKTKRYEGQPGIGTAAYMSPEQANAASRDEIDLRTDVYSFGVLLYELFVGKRPFTGEPAELVQQHLHRPAPPPNIAPRIDAVLLQALSKQPAERQQSMQQLAQELAEALQPAPAVATLLPRPKRRWNKWAVAGLPVTALLATALAYWPFSRDTAPPPSPTPIVATKLPSPSAPEKSGPPASGLAPGTTAAVASNGATGATSAAAPATNSLTVSVWQRDKKNGQPMAVTTAAPFHQGDQLRVRVQAAQQGYLYVVQKQSDGTILRPTVRPIAAEQALTIPANQQTWFTLDNQKGEEILYVFFARERKDPLVAELEQALAQKQATLTAEVLTRLAPATMATAGGDKLTRAGALGAILKLRHE